jgi:FkbM family methyltransferase
MVTIEQTYPTDTPPALGQECRFAAHGESFAALQYFLEHEGVLYPHALSAEPDGSIRLYPEAPGHYVLRVAWCAVSRHSGWAQTDFNLEPKKGTAPQRVGLEGQKLWAPTAWDAHLLGTHEQAVFRELRSLVPRGGTVYDIGANVGLFSVRLAQWIGAEGWLYAFEPNPVCVYFLRANLSQTRVRNFTILPVAISDRPGTQDFRLNYGSSLVGAGGDSPTVSKPGHRIGVDGHRLDSLIPTFRLRPPDFIKLDVEGAEARAIAGMQQTLEAARPSLMIELHGKDAATATLQLLAPLDYHYLRPSTAKTYETADALLDSLRDECVQVIGYH